MENYNEILNTEKERNIFLLRVTCILGGILSPVVTGIWIYIYPELHVGFLSCITYSIVFFLLYILTFKNGFVRRHSYGILYALCFSSSISLILFAYFSSFAEAYAWLIIFVVFAFILVLQKLTHLLVYIITMLAVTITTLYLVKNPGVDRINTIVILLLFCLIGVIHLKSRLDAQKALDVSEGHYRNLFEFSPLSIVISQDEKLAALNPAALKLLDMSDENNAIGKPLADFITDEYKKDLPDMIKKILSGERMNTTEFSLALHHGRTIDVEASSMAIMHKGRPAVMSLVKDITERKLAERKVIEAEARYRGLVESALVGVYLYQDRRITYINPYLEKLIGYTSQELSKMNFIKLIYKDDRHLVGKSSWQSLSVMSTLQFRVIKKDRSMIYIETHAALFPYNGSDAIIGTLLDITHIKKAEEQIRHMAYHDALTGLPNRYHLKDSVSQILEHCKLKNVKLAIMFVDMDRFKIINDTLGHSFGDAILRQASDRLNKCIRKGDTVCRHGGDEFVIVLKNIGRNESAQIAHRIINTFSYPFKINDYEVFSTPSIGISFFPDDGNNVETLVKNADAAMYAAKENGKNNYQFFSSAINEVMSKKMELENGLRKALQNNEFILHYQPQIELETGRIVGMEALIRWQHPILGLIPPSEFIPLSEETGLINRIGEWVLETACIKNKSWQTSGLPFIPIAVNVSGYQLKHSDFTRTVKRALEKSKLDAQYLVIEITESIMQDLDRSNRIVNELKAIGVRVAVDDFGIGYSSLHLLKTLSIDILKIDPSFIRDTTSNPSAVTLIKFIINMGHELKYDIIAEGIETEHQASILKENKCAKGQGYFFNKPLTGEFAEKALRSG